MSGVSCREETWVEPASRQAYHYRLWQPPAPRGFLIIIHGFGEHGGRYHPFAQACAERGVGVVAPDLLGHGRSAGRRGDLERVEWCAEHLIRLTEEVFLPRTGLRRYTVFGHSFGGLVAILWALKAPPALQSVIVQSPLLAVGFRIPGWKEALAKLLTWWWPTFPFAMDLDVGRLSHDPAVAEGYRNDPLVHNTMTARTYCATLRARDAARTRAAALHVPLLLLCGSDDRIISVDAALAWFNQVTCEKHRVVFPGCYHELHHEMVREDVLRLVCEQVLRQAEA